MAIQKIDLTNIGALVSDESYNNFGASARHLRHDWFIDTDFAIWTGPGATGTELTVNTDYALSSRATSAVEAAVGLPVYEKLTILNATYQTGLVYITYKVVRDVIEATDVEPGLNSGQGITEAAEAVAVAQVVALDPSGNLIVASKDDSDKVEVEGVALEAGVDGSQVKYQKRGICAGFTGLSIGAPVFLDDNGAVNQDAVAQVQTNEFRVYLGLAVSATEVDLTIGEPTQNAVPVHSKVTHDTGWVANSDWTNQHLGDTPGSSVVHNLSTNLRDLNVQIMLSTDGTDDNSWMIVDYEAASAVFYGITIYQTDSDTIIVQTGLNGIVFLDANGVGDAADTDSWYYRIIIRKAEDRVLRIIEQGSDDPWHEIGDPGEPAFQNSWANTGGGDVPARFKKLGNIVYVQAQVDTGTYTDGTTIFTLPVTYRPDYIIEAAADGTIPASPGADDTPHVEITAAGEVQCYHVASAVDFGFVIAFPADQ